jgi:glutaredoxin
LTRQLVLYSRPDCHLCDEARAVVADLVAKAPDIQMVERNIEEDDALLRDFLERIPVIELDGQVVGELLVDRQGLSSILLNTSTP